MKSLPFTRIFIALVLSPLAQAALTYHETINGDLSGLGSAPTFLNFSQGVNTISGTMGLASSLDADIFTFNIAPGNSLTSVMMTQFDPVGEVIEGSFFAIAAGSKISTASGSGHAANTLVNASSRELLVPGALLGSKLSGGASALSTPVGLGSYTVWFQETATSVNYTLGFTVVPEPSTSLLALPASALLARRRRRP